MASYIPWFGKKRQRFTERERELMELLQNSRDAKAIIDSAERVRVAKIRALKARRAMLGPSEKNTIEFEDLNSKIEQWLAMPIETIIGPYRKRKTAGTQDQG
jgi:hypothetical protein